MEHRRIIFEPEFRDLIGGVSRTTFWRLKQAPDFPKKIIITKRLSGYYEDEAVDFIQRRQVGGGE